MAEYKIEEGDFIYKTPNVPNAEDYYDINETEEQRIKRISMYNEVMKGE